MENGNSRVPDRVMESYARREQGFKRKPGEARPFYCRTCNAEQFGKNVPAGWYSIMRHSGSREPGERLGVYCSAVCVELQMPRLEAIQEKKLAELAGVGATT